MINSNDLLAWYDENAREMPWRVMPTASKSGVRPDPYHVWLSEVMLQQTTIAAVKKYFRAFRSRWPDVHALAAADDADVMGEWAGLGYYARARNLLKCARQVSSAGGTFPMTEAELLTLPGVGPYTAAAIAAIAFGQPATVVDANVERVMTRIHGVKTPLPDSKPTLRGHAEKLTPTLRAGDYAQAVMDLGATLCGKNPDCVPCPWNQDCIARQLDIATELPRKRPKPPKPTRFGFAYFVRRADGAVLFVTRPEKGLLGGMLALPSTDWTEVNPIDTPPFDANWRTSPDPVRHTFTHFHLVLEIRVSKVGRMVNPMQGSFVNANDIAPSTLPTVMRKAYREGVTMLDNWANYD